MQRRRMVLAKIALDILIVALFLSVCDGSKNNTNNDNTRNLDRLTAIFSPWEYVASKAFPLNQQKRKTNRSTGKSDSEESQNENTQTHSKAKKQNVFQRLLTDKVDDEKEEKKDISDIARKKENTEDSNTPRVLNQTVIKFVLFDSVYQLVVAILTLRTFIASRRPENFYRPNPPSQHYAFEVWNDRYQKDTMAYDRALLSDTMRNRLHSRLQHATRIKERRNHHGSNNSPIQNTTILIELKTEKQLESLHEIVSFLLLAIREKETTLNVLGGQIEILVLLESQGGSVSTFGLLSNQLARIRNFNKIDNNETTSSSPGLKLTICCDKVAASGGYLMACQADCLIAAPFAQIGSIGVLSHHLTINGLLEKLGIGSLLIKSGKYKGVLSGYTEPNNKDIQHQQSKLDATHKAFKKQILLFRPQLINNMDQIATGEVWYGHEALELGLVDKVMTSDEYLTDLLQSGVRVLKIKKYDSAGRGISFRVPFLPQIKSMFISVSNSLSSAL